MGGARGQGLGERKRTSTNTDPRRPAARRVHQSQWAFEIPVIAILGPAPVGISCLGPSHVWLLGGVTGSLSDTDSIPASPLRLTGWPAARSLYAPFQITCMKRCHLWLGFACYIIDAVMFWMVVIWSFVHGGVLNASRLWRKMSSTPKRHPPQQFVGVKMI